MADHYMSAAEIAERLSVTRGAVANWRKRFGPDSIDPFPEPDVYVGNIPGWRHERLSEVIQWLKRS